MYRRGGIISTKQARSMQNERAVSIKKDAASHWQHDGRGAPHGTSGRGGPTGSESERGKSNSKHNRSYRPRGEACEMICWRRTCKATWSKNLPMQKLYPPSSPKRALRPKHPLLSPTVRETSAQHHVVDNFM